MTTPEEALNHVNPYSTPSDLRITDIRFADIVGAPMHCILLRIETNQGITGFGEVRDGASRTYAAMLKGRLLGENPCNVDRLFRRLKQFGGHARRGGGVSGIEVALWDLAGKAYGVPVYQMLGGKFRDRVRMYCDTDTPREPTEAAIRAALRSRLDKGFRFLKMDLGVKQLLHLDGALSGPVEEIERMRSWGRGRGGKHSPRPEKGTLAYYERRHRAFERINVRHPFTGVHFTEKGLDFLENLMAVARDEVGPEVPLALDHLGHIGVEECIRLARRMEKYTPAWMEDPVPWTFTDQYARLQGATTVPICTGEDIYLKEDFRPLLEAGGISVAHPDLLTAGGILEMKKIGDEAEAHGVAMAVHMAESPIACLAAAHCAVATENFLALEYHSADVDWWDDLVSGPPKPIVRDGFIELTDRPGLGIDSLVDEVIEEHLDPRYPELWRSTEEWNDEWANDRTWS